MSLNKNNSHFLRDQLQEILQYLQQHQHDNRNEAILQWIEKNAQAYRENWDELDGLYD